MRELILSLAIGALTIHLAVIVRTAWRTWRDAEDTTFSRARERLEEHEDTRLVAQEVHVLPVNDLIEHMSTDDCVCGPTTEAVFRDDGSNGWLVVHHSLDGRESTEEGRA